MDAEPSRAVPPTRAVTSRLPRPRRDALLDWLTGAAVLAVYGAVQLALRQGPRAFDPARYLEAGYRFPDVESEPFSLRIGLVAPVRAAVVLFGPSEAALYAVPLVTGLVLAGATYATTLVLVRDRVAAAAAALVTVLSGYYLLNSSFLFPDTAAAATFTAGVLCLVLGAMREPRWRPVVFAGAAGVLFGWTYLIREFGPVLLPAVVGALFLLRYPLRRAAVLFTAALAVVSLEFLFGLLRFGDPLARANAVRARPDAPVRQVVRPRMEHIQEQLESPVDTVLVFPRLLLSWPGGWAYLVLLAVFVAALVRLRDRRLVLLAIWCFGFWAFMAAAGLVSLPSGRWLLNITNIRYWYPIFPPLAIGALAGASLLLGRSAGWRRAVFVAAVAAAALAAIVPGVQEYRRCAATNAWASDRVTTWHDFRAWLATPEAQRYDALWADRETRPYVQAFARTTFGERLWVGRIRELRRRPGRAIPAESLPRALVVAHRGRVTELALDEPLEEWVPVFVSDDGVLAALAHSSARPEPAAGPESPGRDGTGGPAAEADTRECRLRPYSLAAPAG